MTSRGDDTEQFRNDLFIRWTRGFSPKEQRISIFSHIRDIPYAIIPEWRGAEDITRLMISENRGWCGPKHHLLVWMFERLGIRMRYISIPFRWQDQQVRYPDSLISLFPFIPDSNHLCCMGFLEEEWRILDATWDPPLQKVGFPINKPWDGVSATIPAVSGISESAGRTISLRSPSRQNRGDEFVHQLNRWFETIRLEECSAKNR